MNNILDRSEIYRINLNTANDNDARIMAYSFIEPDSIVLDVGCACGDFGTLLKKNKNCIVYGFEYNEGSIEIARQAKIYEDIHQVDLNTFDTINYEEYYKKFDNIVILDVLEHLLDSQKVIESLKLFLKDDGCFIISLPNIAHCSIKASLLLNEFTYTDMGILDKTHIKFYTYKSIVEFFSKTCLEIENVKFTIVDLDRNTKLPNRIKKFILHDIHSYIGQYIMRVKISVNNETNLILQNTNAFQIKWDSISQQMNKIRILRLKGTFLPENSIRYKICRKLFKPFLKKLMQN
jgi:2-polyprenyl-3-methyl-5-hydroxy-6-metoxy-1,4-benzoquinol methylase